jgi:hypothetical protein
VVLQLRATWMGSVVIASENGRLRPACADRRFQPLGLVGRSLGLLGQASVPARVVRITGLIFPFLPPHPLFLGLLPLERLPLTFGVCVAVFGHGPSVWFCKLESGHDPLKPEAQATNAPE